MTAEAQGQAFEDTFEALLRALLEADLGYTLIQLSQQPRGSQFGKDLQVRWRAETGEERFWHFECKSHGGPTLPAKEVADKLWSVARSAHEIDVWCLALSDSEPSAEMDELIAGAPASLALDFGLTVLSPKRHFIKRLYACHPALYRRQYGTEAMSLTRAERAHTVEEFAAWIEDESVAHKRRSTPLGWTRIRVRPLSALADDDRHARQYLRGLTLGCPWEAVVHGWAVARPSAEEPVLRVARDSSPGLTYYWLVGAGGEGKSTVLRRVAWQLATEDPETIVLWADETAPSAIPVAWLRALPDGTRVVLFVDETRQFAGPRNVAEDGSWSESGKAIVAILADRGSGWRRHRYRVLPRRISAQPHLLGPLAEDERDGLVAALQERGLLYGVAPADARTRLDRAAEGLRADVQRRHAENAWLVPTLIQLTDPADRPFEDILRSVLTDLREAGEAAALRSLLAIALVHAAGSALPKDIAERIVGGPEAWVDAREALIAELERHLGVPLATGRRSAIEEYETHGAAASAGFVQAAASDSSLADLLSVVCRQLVESMAREYTATDLLRDDRFDLLDRSADYLAEEARLPRMAVELLSAWVGLDDVQGFPAMQRLGTAYSRWLAAARSAPEPDVVELVAILESGRTAFREALLAARAVLTDPGRPRRYDRYDLDEEEVYIYHAWSVLELTAADAPVAELRAHGNLRRAVYLAMLGVARQGRPRIVSLGVLGDSLFALGRRASAASVFAFLEDVSSSNDRVVQRGKRKLARHGVALPTVTAQLLPDAVSAVLGSLHGHLGELNIESTEASHLAKLRRAVDSLSTEFPSDGWPTVVEEQI